MVLASWDAADGEPQRLADAACADGADDGRGAHIDLEPQQRVTEEIRHDLGHDREPDALDPIGADGAQALVSLHVGVLDDFEEEFSERGRSCGC